MIFALYHQAVGEVDADGVDADAHLPGAACGRLNLFDHQIFRGP